ncbi:MAG: chromate transporter [Clostridia bacterium]|nr:chromate transporter [Clostridia bacterium]
MILLELFLSFLQIGLFSIGGGYAAIPLIQYQTVTLHGWLTAAQFLDLATIAEMTPGPIAINGATFVGLQIAGIPGAVAATLGCIFPSLILVSILAWVYRKYRSLPLLQSVLSSLRPAVVALIASAGLNMLLQVIFGSTALRLSRVNVTGAALFLAALLVLRRFKPSPILVMADCGLLTLLLGLLGIV